MIKNYTSQTQVQTSIAKIEKLLAENGAKQILKLYDDGKVIGICFIIDNLTFRLPARVEECEQILRHNAPARARKETLAKIPAQAARTSWKILSDWVEAQMALIQLRQAELAEVFLPYLFDQRSNKTMYQVARESNYVALLGPSQNEAR